MSGTDTTRTGGVDAADPAVDPLPRGVCIYNVNPGVVTHQYTLSVAGALTYPMDPPVVGYFQRPGTGLLSIMRSAAVDHFLTQTTGEWMHFIDSDIEFGPDEIERQVALCHPVTAPLVCGLYISGLAEGLSPIAWPDEHGDAFTAAEMRALIDEGTKLLPCKRFGAGFLTMHRDALMKMRDADPIDSWFGEMVYEGVRQGEDFTFCLRALACDIPLHVNLDANLGHVKTIVMSKSMLGNVQVESRQEG